jgi:nicotinamidase-related amidase
MRRDKTKSILSIIATLVSIVLILIYWLAPAGEASHPLYKLFIDCIPDSIIVLITIPIVYWLLYTRGLTNMGDCPLFTGHSPPEPGQRHSHHHHRPAKDAKENRYPGIERDLLLVAGLPDDSAGDPNTGEIMASLNDTLRRAEARAMPVIFAKCCLSPLSTSTEKDAASRAAGATATERDAELPHDLYKPAGSAVIEYCVQPQTPASPAPENAAMDMLISNPAVRSVYVTGIAPEYFIRAICRYALRHGKKTIALSNAIDMPDNSIEQSEKMWRDLSAEGLVRQERLS